LDLNLLKFFLRDFKKCNESKYLIFVLIIFLMREPRWIESFENSFRRKYGEIALSDRFANLMSANLIKDFFAKTGIDIKKTKGKIKLIQSSDFCKVVLGKEIGLIEAELIVFQYGTDCTISWKGEKGKIILPSDEFIKENEISFWFEKLSVASIMRDYAKITKKRIFFDPKRFHYTVEYDAFLWEGLFFQFFLKDQTNKAEEVERLVDDFVLRWNETSEQSNRFQGVIHFTEITKLKNNFVEYYMDLGSASHVFLEQFLLYMNSLDAIEKVKITSFP